MEILFLAINFILLITLIVCPVFIINKLYKRNSKNTFTPYLILAIITTFPVILVLAWWSHFSCELLLSHFGYNFEAWNDLERFKNVAIENLAKVKEIDKSRMGIGWPLKAFIFYPIYSAYLFILYFVFYFYKKSK